MTDEPMVEEFDTVATWTADAIDQLGQDHALPAACRGSGTPAALRWLGDQMGLRGGTRLIDSGAGVGGPARHAQETHAVQPFLVDPMLGACRAAHRLFDHEVVVGDGAALPLGDACFEAGWSLGVLCTIEDKDAHLAELGRVVAPGGTVGLLAFVRTVTNLADPPEGNYFVADDELHALAAAAGLDVVSRAWLGDFDPPPPAWAEAADAVQALIRERHGASASYQAATRNQNRMIDLLDEGAVAGRLLVCRVARPS